MDRLQRDVRLIFNLSTEGISLFNTSSEKLRNFFMKYRLLSDSVSRRCNTRRNRLERSMAKPAPGATIESQVVAYGVPNIRRHLLLCPGPDCVDPARGEAAWSYLKKRLSELRLEQAPTHLFRTKVHCLRMCMRGPIAVVLPEGVWYHSADPPVIERILQEHILGGHVVTEFTFAEQRLDAGISLAERDA